MKTSYRFIAASNVLMIENSDARLMVRLDNMHGPKVLQLAQVHGITEIEHLVETDDQEAKAQTFKKLAARSMPEAIVTITRVPTLFDLMLPCIPRVGELIQPDMTRGYVVRITAVIYVCSKEPSTYPEFSHVVIRGIMTR